MQIKSLLLALNQRPVAYYPIYAEITGCVTGGVVLSQLMYWWAAVDGRKFYKTDAELCTETRLSVKELATAKKAIAETGAVRITREGLPAKTYYEIDATALAELVEQVMPKRDNRTSAKGTTVYAESGQHSYAETTPKNTTESMPAPEIFVGTTDDGDQLYQTAQVERTGPDAPKSKRSKKDKGTTLLADVYTREAFMQAWSWTDYAKAHPEVDPGLLYDRVEAWSTGKGERRKDWLAVGRTFVSGSKPGEFTRKQTTVRDTVEAQLGRELTPIEKKRIEVAEYFQRMQNNQP